MAENVPPKLSLISLKNSPYKSTYVHVLMHRMEEEDRNRIESHVMKDVPETR